MIDRNKLPFRIGDVIISTEMSFARGIIIGYYFFTTYNDYNHIFGYTIKTNEDNLSGHSIGTDTYTFNGNPINSSELTGYWWVRHSKTKLIRRSLIFLLKL